MSESDKMTENSLSSSGNDFFYLSPAPLIVIDIEKTIIKHANPAALELYQADSADEIGAGFSEIIGAGGKETLDKINYLLSSGERRFRVETVNYTLEGRKIDVILHISVPESKGTPDFSNVMVYPKDITEGKVIQDELRILSVLPEANPDIVVIMQCENKVIPTLPKKM